MKSQETDASILGCITQPAHAGLAGRLAAILNGQLFGKVPDEIVETIGSHDAGWSEMDLAALESAEHTRPISFVSTPSAIAVRAWRRSISEAETRSPLTAYVVRSHFCLLAPRDENVEHLLFWKEEKAQIDRSSLELKGAVQDAERFVAFLGFCDLLSLHLCSGWSCAFELPLAHPAHPSSRDARSISIWVKKGALHVDEINVPRGTSVYVNGWERIQSGSFQNQRFEWTFQ